jgi:phosphohistidine phosphatase
MAGAQRRLLILRHAKSDRSAGVIDLKRPLADRGRRDAPAVGRWLREHVADIDLVVCSPATRARQTWDLAAAELPEPPPVRHDDRIYDATAGELLSVVRALPSRVRTVVLVGHNPGFEELVELLTGDAHELKTSAIAVVAGPGSWASVAAGWGELVALATPRGE